MEAFERDFAVACQSSHAVAVNSTTSVLHLALPFAGACPGAEVATVAFNSVGSVVVILEAGAIPVYLDIDPKMGPTPSFNLGAPRFNSAGRVECVDASSV